MKTIETNSLYILETDIYIDIHYKSSVKIESGLELDDILEELSSEGYNLEVDGKYIYLNSQGRTYYALKASFNTDNLDVISFSLLC